MKINIDENGVSQVFVCPHLFGKKTEIVVKEIPFNNRLEEVFFGIFLFSDDSLLNRNDLWKGGEKRPLMFDDLVDVNEFLRSLGVKEKEEAAKQNSSEQLEAFIERFRKNQEEQIELFREFGLYCEARR